MEPLHCRRTRRSTAETKRWYVLSLMQHVVRVHNMRSELQRFTLFTVSFDEFWAPLMDVQLQMLRTSTSMYTSARYMYSTRQSILTISNARLLKWWIIDEWWWLMTVCIRKQTLSYIICVCASKRWFFRGFPLTHCLMRSRRGMNKVAKNFLTLIK